MCSANHVTAKVIKMSVGHTQCEWADGLLAVGLGKGLGAFLRFPVYKMKMTAITLTGLLKGCSENWSSACT